MTNEELADIRAYVAERAAKRARGEHIDSDERREAALLVALDEARTQLAALHAAASEFIRNRGKGPPARWPAEDALEHCLSGLATAAAEHDARVRADMAAEVVRVLSAAPDAVQCVSDAAMTVLKAIDERVERVRADEQARALREDPIALAYGIADREAAGPQVGEVYRRPNGGTMEVVEVRRGSWRLCVYRSETGETHERTHPAAWALADEAEKETR